MFSPDDDFLADHHIDHIRNYYSSSSHHQVPTSTSSAASLYRHLKSSSATTSTPSALSSYSRNQYQDSTLGSSITNAASRISIREANDHLQLLHQRVGDLEDIIRSQGSALSGKDIEFRRQIQELKESKERQISELSMVIAKLEGKNQQLVSEIQEKCGHLNGCQQKLIMLDQILTTSLPPLEQLIADLKQFSLNNPDMVQLTNPVTTVTMATNGSNDGSIKNNGLMVESAPTALQRSPVVLSPSVVRSPAIRSPAIRSPAIRSPAARTNPIVVEEIPTAHLISATSALINSSIMDVQSTDSGNASDSSRTNSYGQVLDELKEVQQMQHHGYQGMVSSPRRRSLEKQKPIEEPVPASGSIPTIVETSMSDLAKDIDITDELNRTSRGKVGRKLPHAFGKESDVMGTNGSTSHNPGQISAQLMINHPFNSSNNPSQLSPSINRVMKTSSGQVLSSALVGGNVSNTGAGSNTFSTSPLKGSHPNQSMSQLMSSHSLIMTGAAGTLSSDLRTGPTTHLLYQQYQQRNSVTSGVLSDHHQKLSDHHHQRSSALSDGNVNISKVRDSEKIGPRYIDQTDRYLERNMYQNSSRSNNNNYGRNFDFDDEDDFDDYDEQDEYDDEDAPPPPAPPPSTNTSNISLPSLQAPRRFLQPSYH